MVNGLAVLGWGVGGIEAEAAMLGQPISMLIPEVIGFKLTGKLREGVTATDLVLTVTQMLRKKGVVGKFVEFYGPGLGSLTLADRATIANMAPGIRRHLRLLPGRRRDASTTSPPPAATPARVALVEKPTPRRRACSARRATPDPVFTDTLELDLGDGRALARRPEAPAGPRAADRRQAGLRRLPWRASSRSRPPSSRKRFTVEGTNFDLGHGDVVIAAITSCTNTSNPERADRRRPARPQRGRERACTVKPWVKTSLAPGSQVVTDYLAKSGLQKSLDTLGFNLVGYGCTTCIGNSGPLPAEISKAINDNDLVAAAVLSGNRNFEGRVNPDVRANYLASPPLVVAYALAGSHAGRPHQGAARHGQERQARLSEGHLADLQGDRRDDPQDASPRRCSSRTLRRRLQGRRATGRRSRSRAARPTAGTTRSTYVQNPPYFEGMTMDAEAGRPTSSTRASSACSSTRSPPTTSRRPARSRRRRPAGKYLIDHQVAPADFN